MAFRTNKTPVLQEKTASGSVASFNTALAMPLASCNIAVNAWQEGSGDPSPDNVRPIHGFSEVNIYQRGINQWDEETESGMIDTTTGQDVANGVRTRTKNYNKCLPNTTYYACSKNNKQLSLFFYDADKNFIRYSNATNNTFITPSNAYYFRFFYFGTTYDNDISINYPSTDTDYHAYTGNTYTIQLGQEVYGAEVDVVNGVAHCTHGFADLGDFNWVVENDNIFRTSTNTPTGAKSNGSIISSQFTYNANSTGSNRPNYTINLSSYFGPNKISVKDSDYTTAADFKTGVTGVKCVYELAQPFDIQLTPQQIETLIGNNTIFADTGDVDLTFKDLDIAKRGSFREVFKLP